MKIINIYILLTCILFADIKVGEIFPNLVLIDQFDKKIELQTKGNSLVMVSFEKDISTGIKIFLDSKDKDFLEDNNITYISDISTVSSLLMSWVVLPKLKKFLFSVALIYGNDGDILNREKGKVSIFRLENNQVYEVEFLKVEELEKYLLK